MASFNEGTFRITFNKARGLRSVTSIATQDPYCKLNICGTVFKTKVHRNGGRNPKWESDNSFEQELGTDFPAYISIRHAGSISDETIGTCAFNTSVITQRPNEEQTLWLDIVSGGRLRGQLEVTLFYAVEGYVSAAEAARLEAERLAAEAEAAADAEAAAAAEEARRVAEEARRAEEAARQQQALEAARARAAAVAAEVERQRELAAQEREAFNAAAEEGRAVMSRVVEADAEVDAKMEEIGDVSGPATTLAENTRRAELFAQLGDLLAAQAEAKREQLRLAELHALKAKSQAKEYADAALNLTPLEAAETRSNPHTERSPQPLTEGSFIALMACNNKYLTRGETYTTASAEELGDKQALFHINTTDELFNRPVCFQDTKFGLESISELNTFLIMAAGDAVFRKNTNNTDLTFVNPDAPGSSDPVHPGDRVMIGCNGVYLTCFEGAEHDARLGWSDSPTMASTFILVAPVVSWAQMALYTTTGETFNNQERKFDGEGFDEGHRLEINTHAEQFSLARVESYITFKSTVNRNGLDPEELTFTVDLATIPADGDTDPKQLRVVSEGAEEGSVLLKGQRFRLAGGSNYRCFSDGLMSKDGDGSDFYLA